MPTNIRAIVQATFDRPDSVAATADGDYGFLGQFRFLDHRIHQDWDRLSEHPLDDWDYTSGGTYTVEPLPELRACAPRHLPFGYDMCLQKKHGGTAEVHNWVSTNTQGHVNCSNLWQERRLGQSNIRFAYFRDGRGRYDATNAYYGELSSRVDDVVENRLNEDPNWALRMFRYRPPRNLPQGGFNYVEVEMMGRNGFGQWSLYLPGPVAINRDDSASSAYARAWMYPRLGYRASTDSAYEVAMEFTHAISMNRVGFLKPYYQYVTWETVDGHILLNIDGMRYVYLVPAEQRHPANPDDDSTILWPGPMRITVYGAPVALNFSPLNYPLGCAVQYKKNWPISSAVWNVPAVGSENQTTNYAQSWAPALAASSVTVSVGPNFQEWTDEDGDSVNDTAWYAPKVVFSSPSEFRRAVCYVGQVDLEPAIGAGTSSSYATQGNNVVTSASGMLSNKWRNNRCRLQLECERADADALLANIIANGTCSVTAGWDTDGGADTAAHFVGYVAERSVTPGTIERRRVNVTLRDGFMRLERKFWVGLGCFQAWDLSDVFKRCLNQWGIPDSRIKFQDASGTSYLIDAFPGGGPKVPRRSRRGDLRFDFDNNQPAISGLSEIVEACGYRWGYDREGFWFCGPPAIYNGTPDFTLTWNVDSALQPQELESDFLKIETPEGHPFVNNVLVIVKNRGVEEIGWMRDTDSIHDSTAKNFVGDDFWHIEQTSEGSAAARALELLTDRLKRSRGIRFKVLDGQVDLWPDMSVQVNVVGHDLTTNDIYQISEKHWNADQNGEYKTTFEAVYWPEANA